MGIKVNSLIIILFEVVVPFNLASLAPPLPPCAFFFTDLANPCRRPPLREYMVYYPPWPVTRAKSVAYGWVPQLVIHNYRLRLTSSFTAESVFQLVSACPRTVMPASESHGLRRVRTMCRFRPIFFLCVSNASRYRCYPSTILPHLSEVERSGYLLL